MTWAGLGELHEASSLPMQDGQGVFRAPEGMRATLVKYIKVDLGYLANIM